MKSDAEQSAQLAEIMEDIGLHHIRVRYAEIDQMGVAHHGAYVAWLEEARTEWIRARVRSYRSLEEEGTFLAVARVSIRFLSPARYDDLLRIETRLTHVGKASFDMEYKLSFEGRLLAEAQTRLAVLDEHMRPMKIPPGLFNAR